MKFLSKLKYFTLIIFGVVGIVAEVYSLSIYKGLLPLPISLVDEIGRQQEKSLNSMVLSPGSETSQFADEKTYSIAKELYSRMQKENSGILKDYNFSSIADLKKVVICLSYEILAGETTPLLVYKNGDYYNIGWSDGSEIINQNQIANTYIDEVFEDNKTSIDSFETEKEKANYIADLIVDSLITGYDYSYQTRTIYDLYNSESKTGVCSVYTTLFDKLCERAGLDCYIEIGKKEDGEELHCWNKVIFNDGCIVYYDLTSYSTGHNNNFKAMSLDYYNYQYLYKMLKQKELGYKVALNILEK